MVVHICNSSTSEAETEGLLQVEAYLVCTENLKCLKTKQKNKNQKPNQTTLQVYEHTGMRLLIKMSREFFLRWTALY